MRTIIKSAALCLPLLLNVATVTVARAEKPVATRATQAKVDWKHVEQHLREHQEYPATRAQLVASCNNLVDFEDGEKKWFAAALPDGTYKSADDVLKVLKAAR
jgi:hypothetical protein